MHSLRLNLTGPGCCRCLTLLACVLLLSGEAFAQFPRFGRRVVPGLRRQEFPYPSNVRKPVLPPEVKSTQQPGTDRPIRQSPPLEYAPGVPLPNVFEPPLIPDTLEQHTPKPYEESPSLRIPGPALPTMPTIPRETRLPVNSALMTNYNFGLAVTETLLNELASDVRQDASAVYERMLGADVTGSQTTTATTRINCRRNSQMAQFDVVLESLTNSNTIGRRPNAMVATEGCHRADLVKPVFFDGQRFTTRRPQGFVRANNVNRDVRTPYGTLPLFGPMANQIARSQTERLRATAEAETANRLAQRVVPQFNQSVDQQLVAANVSLAGRLRTWLTSMRLYPEELRTTTTDDELRMRARMGAGTAVSIPGRRLSGRLGSVLLHESAVNEYLDGMNLAGRSFSDAGLKDLVAALKNGQSPDSVVMPEPTLFSIVLADRNPIQIRFVDNTTEVIVRVSIKPVGASAIPMQEVRVPLKADMTSSLDNMILNYGTPRVSAVDGSEPTSIQEVIGQQVAERLQPIEVAKRHTVQVSPQKSLQIKISQIESTNGWLLLGVD